MASGSIQAWRMSNEANLFLLKSLGKAASWNGPPETFKRQSQR